MTTWFPLRPENTSPITVPLSAPNAVAMSMSSGAPTSSIVTRRRSESGVPSARNVARLRRRSKIWSTTVTARLHAASSITRAKTPYSSQRTAVISSGIRPATVGATVPELHRREDGLPDAVPAAGTDEHPGQRTWIIIVMMAG
jgi:hypothetical protein